MIITKLIKNIILDYKNYQIINFLKVMMKIFKLLTMIVVNKILKTILKIPVY